MIHEPAIMTREMKKKIIARERYKRAGGLVSCGHDFWETAKTAEYGDTVLCTRCCQYFVKTKDLVWWKDGDMGEYSEPSSCHLLSEPYTRLGIEPGAWYMPVPIRAQDYHGNDLRGFVPASPRERSVVYKKRKPIPKKTKS